jgi:tRNA nucleotidyltransferase (CCA-adding enzyme)
MAIEEDRKAIRRWISQLSPSVFFQLLQVKRADNMAQAPAYHDEQAHLDRLEQLARRILIEEECLTRRDLALNGRDLLERGFQGKEVGRCLDHLLEAVMEEKVKNEKQALLAYLSE